MSTTLLRQCGWPFHVKLKATGRQAQPQVAPSLQHHTGPSLEGKEQVGRKPPRESITCSVD